MLPLLADENFNGSILRGLFRRTADLDLVRVQDVALTGADDPTVLAWAATHDRVLLTHDVSTSAGLPMPGVFKVPRTVSIGRAIEDLLLIIECSVPDEWNGQVRYLPL